MNNNSNEQEISTDSFLSYLTSKANEMPELRIPLGLFSLSEAEDDTVFPPYETSLFHKDERYYCFTFYKPLSQYSKLI